MASAMVISGVKMTSPDCRRRFSLTSLNFLIQLFVRFSNHTAQLTDGAGRPVQPFLEAA